MDFQLRRIIDLVKKTGDRMVVVNYKDPQDSFVVMDLFDYENLVDTKYDEIPVVDMDEPYEDFEFDPEDASFDDNFDDFQDYKNEPDDDYAPDFREEDIDFEPQSTDFLSNNRENFIETESIWDDIDKNDEYGKIEHKSPKERWSIPSEIKEGGNEAGSEEDRYYFENI